MSDSVFRWRFRVKNKYDVKGLDFELIRKFRFVIKTDLAKSKLLTGKQIFKLNNNDCNFIEVIDTVSYLHWKTWISLIVKLKMR